MDMALAVTFVFLYIAGFAVFVSGARGALRLFLLITAGRWAARAILWGVHRGTPASWVDFLIDAAPLAFVALIAGVQWAWRTVRAHPPRTS
ncbi:MAG: hypothetical protein IRZ18_09415 [Clostridia bacterium]|nr:hypothetical protein [Clostridia bacterium]